jgi:hypothetical protein
LAKHSNVKLSFIEGDRSVKIEHFLNSILQLGCGKGIDAGFNEGCAGGNLAWRDPSYLVEQATQYRENI